MVPAQIPISTSVKPHAQNKSILAVKAPCSLYGFIRLCSIYLFRSTRDDWKSWDCLSHINRVKLVICVSDLNDWFEAFSLHSVYKRKCLISIVRNRYTRSFHKKAEYPKKLQKVPSFSAPCHEKKSENNSNIVIVKTECTVIQALSL